MSVRLYSNVDVAESGDAPAAHNILSAEHTISGGAALDLVGQSAADTLARVTPSAAPGAAAKVLATTAAGLLTLQDLTLATDLRAGGGAYFGKTSTDPARGEIHTSDATITSGVRVCKPSGWAYNKNGYRALVLGHTDAAVRETVCIGYDPSANGFGGFTGDGREVLWRRGHLFMTPNAADDSMFTQIFMKDGLTGLGTTKDPSADGRTTLRTFGTVGGFILWDYNGLDGTTRTIIAHGTEDVVSYLAVHFIIQPSTGAATGGTVFLATNANTTLYNVGSDVVTIYVSAAGAVTVARTGGTLTYKLIVQLLWL